MLGQTAKLIAKIWNETVDDPVDKIEECVIKRLAVLLENEHCHIPLGQVGADFAPYPSKTLKSIKVMAVKLEVLIVRSKMPPLSSATRSDNVIPPGIAALLDFWIFPILQETDEIGRKVTKTNIRTKNHGKKSNFSSSKKGIFLFS